MVVKKVEAINVYAVEGSEPYEIRTLLLQIDGITVELGRFYFGPGMNREHAKIYDVLKKFLEQSENYFKE